MALVGNYNASTFVLGNYATYPQLPAGAALYTPAMHWYVSVAGTVQGTPVAVGDLLFATQGGGRLFGDGNYGDQIFGGISDGGWTAAQVLFLRWEAGRPAPDSDPYPNAGCAFTREGQPGGDWAPGWRIVIDAYFPNIVGSRTYGTGTFGADVYGDINNTGSSSWVDITRPGYRIETGDGTTAGGQRVPVSEVVISLFDDTGDYFDIADPASWYQPQPGTPLRVGFIDPTFTYHPVIVGEIERIEDVHDDEHPRVVTVRGFGRIMDLTVDVPQVQRPSELASARFNALAYMAGWNWDAGAVVFPDDTTLLADTAPRDIVVRDEIDRTAQSCGWMFDADRRGRMRLREWPHEPQGPAIVVVDCFDDTTATDARLAPSIVFANDQASLLNYVMTTNTDGASTISDNTLSTSRFGKRGRALDYPKPGLAWSSGAEANGWAWRIAQRFGYITKRVESFEVDTDTDTGWLAVLAPLDTGRAVTVQRAGIRPLTLDAVIVGWRHTIEPGRWRSLLFTSTTTSSM